MQLLEVPTVLLINYAAAWGSHSPVNNAAIPTVLLINGAPACGFSHIHVFSSYFINID
jgi:hypothetical protein